MRSYRSAADRRSRAHASRYWAMALAMAFRIQHTRVSFATADMPHGSSMASMHCRQRSRAGRVKGTPACFYSKLIVFFLWG